MCGIAGIFLGKQDVGNQTEPIEPRLRKLLAGIRHRGPDDSGLFLSPSASCGIGMVRLSIIDLATGQQPMLADGGRYSFVFNGELYNYVTLRGDLKAQGVQFRTQSDTEVAMHAVIHYGVDKAVTLFDGMFAFCLWDEVEQVAYLARDHYGEKPLFFFERQGEIAFCSETPPLVQGGFSDRTLNLESVARYLAYQFNSGENTLINGIKRLRPGGLMEVHRRQGKWAVSLRCYFSPSDHVLIPETRGTMGPMEAQHRVKAEIENTIRSRLVADVPVGIFLSGGLDSSIVAFEATRMKSDVQTFSIGFEDPEFNESPYSRRVADYLGTRHTEYVFTLDDFCAGFDALVPSLSEPFADAAAIPTSLLAKFARQNVKVVLSGEGADEIFGGYAYYHSNHPLGAHEVIGGARFFSGFPAVYDNIALRSLLGWRNGAYSYAERDKAEFVSLTGVGKSRPLTARERMNLMLSYDIFHWLPGDLLAKVDTSTMMHSLECRAPFLNRKLHELVFSLGPHLRAKNEIQKYLLKLLYFPSLPREILFRKKQGFGLPLHVWMRHGKLKRMAEEWIFGGPMTKRRVLNPAFVRRAWDDHQRGTANNERKILTLMMLNAWVDKMELGF